MSGKRRLSAFPFPWWISGGISAILLLILAGQAQENKWEEWVMIDQYGRTIDYLRLSVTDLCNYRCRYCMPEEGVEKGPHGSVLSVEECGEIARRRYAVACGRSVSRRRAIGAPGDSGHLPDPAGHPELEELCLTTTAACCRNWHSPCGDAGVDRLNISLDTLQPERFRRSHAGDPGRGPLRHPGGGGRRVPASEAGHGADGRRQR